MSNEEIGRLNIDIGLTDGNFTRNVAKINREIKATEAEIKSVTAGVGKFEKSLETLSAESQLTAKNLNLQQLKTQQLKREYERLLETKKEDSKEVQNAFTRYKRNEAQMKRTEATMRQVNKQIQEQGNSYNQLSRDADKALSGIQQDLRVLESEYKLTAAGMTRMGSESQHLHAQSQQMQKVFHLESKAVAELRRKLDEAKRVKGEDARETKELQIQYNNARAKANETRQTLDRLNNTIADQSGRWGRLRQRMHDASGGFDDVRNNASGMADGISRGFGVASLAIGGGLAYASKKSMDFESQLSSIQALTGASADEMARMRDLAQEMGAKTVFSSLEAAQAIEELLKAGLTPAQVEAGGLQEALNLATAGGLDLAKAAEIMSTALNAYKDDGMSAADASNILAGSANASATSVEELQYGLAQVGAVASGVGLSFRDTNAALGVFANNGLIYSPVTRKLVA
ncbi:phage tail tape measure protein [Priestia megaterium]|uniref:phage tail tape measure protein n=1 Tax=Priestia megaterium TaxID=1404 RepID=UPI002D7F411C|nr:phage tail tape measure protein [Priestia megaterium]MEB4861158.1 phage tail tape measure protein [Priestia megaterium]